MSYPQRSGLAGAVHPTVFDRRVRDLARTGATALIPLGIALGIALRVPNPSLLTLVAVVVGGVGILTLAVSSRLELTVALLALYLGLLDGPVKLLTGGHAAASVVRDVLIFTVCFGALMRLLARRERVRLPPLSGWVLAFVALIVIEAFNPKTEGIAGALGGFRQQGEWILFFFFGYAIMRNKKRFQALFLIVGLIALANGIVATYQTRLSPQQLASWGPGYREKVLGTAAANGKKGLAGRTFASEGVAHVRPLALGSDAGFGGGVGVIALPFALALLAIGRLQRRWIALVLCLGALVAVATSLGRLAVIGAVIAAVSFALLSFTAGRRFARPFAALLVVAAVAVPLGAVFVASESGGTFARYESIEPNKAASTSTGYKTGLLKLIPRQIAATPFGIGLGTVGAARGFSGANTEGDKGLTSETQYNFITDELGLPGLILWVAFSLYLIALVVRRLPRVKDVELRIALAGVFAPMIAMFFMGFSGPLTTSAVLGPYFWFAAGVAAYWFVGPGRSSSAATAESVP